MAAILKFLTTIVAINFFLNPLFGKDIKEIKATVKGNLYKIILYLERPLRYKPRLFSDLGRHILVLKLRNKGKFFKDFYSVSIIGEKDCVIFFFKNPKLELKRTKVFLNKESVIVSVPITKRKISKYVIVIDPGHGGKDPGATYFGVREKDINFSVARKLFKLLSKDSRFEVYLTRKGDYFVSLADRQLFTAKVKADLFISIHTNADPNTPNHRGVSFYILSDRGLEEKLRDLMKNSKERRKFINLFPKPDRALLRETIKGMLLYNQLGGERFALTLRSQWCKYLSKYIPCGGIYKRAFAVLKTPGVPSVLVELGFMTNKRDLKLLISQKFQERVAEVIYKAIRLFFQ